VNVSEKVNSTQGFFTNYLNGRGPLRKLDIAGAHGRVSPGNGPAWAGFSPVLLMISSFLFLFKFGNPSEILEK
jgi:hypothetical protein